MVREKIAVHLVHRVYGGYSLGLPFLTNRNQCQCWLAFRSDAIYLTCCRGASYT